MNRVLIGAAAALVLLVGAALAAPSLIDWNKYRMQIAARVEAAVGRAVLINGDVDFSLFPAPAISVHQVRIANPKGAAAPSLVSLGSLDIRVAFTPLLRGEVEVRKIVLQEPVFEYELLADGRSNWSLTTGDAQADVGFAALARSGVRIDNVVVHNGIVTYRDGQRGIIEQLRNLNADISARGTSGPYLGEGDFTYRGLPVRFAVNSAAVAQGRPVGLRAELNLGPDNERLEVRGNLSEPSANATFAGTLAFDGKSFAGLAERVFRAYLLPPPAMPGWAVPVRLTAQTNISATEAGFNDIDLRIGELGGKGAINVAFGAVPRVDATVAISQLDLDALAVRAERERRPGATPLTAPAAFWLPTAMDGSLALTIDALTVRQRLVRNLDVAAALRSGAVELSRARAQLPGLSDIDAKGQVIAAGGAPQFDGDVTMRSDNLRDLLSWLTVDMAKVPADRVRTAVFQGRMRARPDLLQAYGFDLRFDSTQVNGAAAYAIRTRPAFSIDVDVDRIDLDAYALGGIRAWSMPLATLENFDTDLRLRFGELKVAELPAHGVVIDSGLVGGMLTVREISVAEVAGAKGLLTGIATGFGGRMSGTGTVNFAAESPAGLLRALGAEPGTVTPERLGPVTFNASLDGDRDKLTIDAGALVLGAELRLQGNVRSFGDHPSLDLVFDARHANLAGLAQTLGLGSGARRGAATPLALRGTLAGGLDSLAVGVAGQLAGADMHAAGTVGVADAITYRFQITGNHADASAWVADLGLRYRPAPDLGPASLRATLEGSKDAARFSALQVSIGAAQLSGTAGADWSRRPLLAAKVSAGAVDLDRFLPPAPAATTAPRREWSNEPLPVGLLRRADLDIELGADRIEWRGRSYGEVSAAARSRDGTLYLSPVRAKAFDGTAELGVTIVAAEVPTIDVTLALQDVDLATMPPISWAVVPVSGRAMVRADFAATGASERELAANLVGAASAALRDGVVRGVALAETGARIDRLKDVADLPDLLAALTAQGETRYQRIELSVRAADGVASFDKLGAQMDGVSIGGGGTVDFPRRRTAIELAVGLAGQPEAPPFSLELSGAWEQPRRLARSRDLQGFVARRIATAPAPVVPFAAVPAPEPVPEAAPPPPAPVPFEEQMRGFLQNLQRP